MVAGRVGKGRTIVGDGVIIENRKRKESDGVISTI